MSIQKSQIIDNQLQKFTKLKRIWIILFILSFLEILSAQIFKELLKPNPEFGLLTLIILGISSLIFGSRIGGVLAALVYWMSSIIFLPSLVYSLYYHFKERKIKKIHSEVNQVDQLKDPSTIKLENYIKESFSDRFILMTPIIVMVTLFIIGIMAGIFFRSNQVTTNPQIKKLEEQINQELDEIKQISNEITFCMELETWDKDLIENCYLVFKDYAEKFSNIQLFLEDEINLLKNYQPNNEKEARFISNYINVLASDYYRDLNKAIFSNIHSWLNFFQYLKDKEINTPEDIKNLTYEEKLEFKKLAQDIDITTEQSINKAKTFKKFLYENFDYEFIQEAKKYAPNLWGFDNTEIRQ